MKEALPEHLKPGAYAGFSHYPSNIAGPKSPTRMTVA